jgi:hypothetical protein
MQEHCFLLGLRCVVAFVLALPVPAYAASRVQAAAVPRELKSTAFTVTVNGQSVDVAHAAASYDWVSFDTTGPVNIVITALEAGFWDRGVDIQPWRLGLRPVRNGQTIRFRLTAPAKLSIGRPGDFLNHAALLFLFAGSLHPRRRLRALKSRSFQQVFIARASIPKPATRFILHRARLFSEASICST